MCIVIGLSLPFCFRPRQSGIHLIVTAARLAQLDRCLFIVQEVAGSNPDLTNTQGLITEENVLPLL